MSNRAIAMNSLKALKSIRAKEQLIKQQMSTPDDACGLNVTELSAHLYTAGNPSSKTSKRRKPGTPAYSEETAVVDTENNLKTVLSCNVSTSLNPMTETSPLQSDSPREDNEKITHVLSEASNSNQSSEFLDEDTESVVSEDEEDAEDYCRGGYHPVCIGDTYLDGRYIVLRKLGWGHFSTVWLAKDTKYSRPVALKIVRSASNYTEAAIDEIKLLEKVVKANRNDPHRRYIVELCDSFKVKGPHGTHIVMAFEVLGPNLWNMIRRYHRRGIPIDIVKRITKQVVMGLDYLHSECGIIHTDLKPENILIAIDVSETMRQLGLHDLNSDPLSQSPVKQLDTLSPHSATASQPSSCSTLPPQSPLKNTANNDLDSNKSANQNPLAKDQKKMVKKQALKRGLPESTESLVSLPTFGNGFGTASSEKYYKGSPTDTHESSHPQNIMPSHDINNDDASESVTSSIFENNDFEDHYTCNGDAEVARATLPPSPPSNPLLGVRALKDTGSIRGNQDSRTFHPESSGSAMSSIANSLNLDENQPRFLHGKNTEVLEKTLSDISLLDVYEVHGSSRLPSLSVSDQHCVDTNPVSLSGGACSSSVQDIPYRQGAHSPKQADDSEDQLMDIGSTHESVDRKRRRNESKTEANRRADRSVIVKLADLGNACWVNHHFTSDIQTRQYRSPEVIIGAHYDTSADIWSLGCILFELLTGDYLFDPQAGSRYTKDDDHAAQIVELLGNFPKNMALSGKYSSNLFTRKGELRHIHKLRFWRLQDVLHEKYHFSVADATAISSFILPMLEINPLKRATAAELLRHEWLKDVTI
ncbi:serine/threonine protein kinase, CMGC [Batrachochytrium dendrobatidis]|nr:serine/threonine protein kinase, CMGC [Batrachochytrium dendrobatidis]